MSGSRYDGLAHKVDAFAERVGARYPSSLTCARGCSGCCHQHLSLVAVELRRVAGAVLELSELERAAIRRRVQAGREDPRCPLLSDAGACRIYEARPMICRTHGLPIRVGSERDVCPLNFATGPALGEIDDDCVLDVEHLNRLLGLIDHLEAAHGEGRTDLFDGLAAILG